MESRRLRMAEHWVPMPWFLHIDSGQLGQAWGLKTHRQQLTPIAIVS